MGLINEIKNKLKNKPISKKTIEALEIPLDEVVIPKDVKMTFSITDIANANERKGIKVEVLDQVEGEDFETVGKLKAVIAGELDFSVLEDQTRPCISVGDTTKTATDNFDGVSEEVPAEVKEENIATVETEKDKPTKLIKKKAIEMHKSKERLEFDLNVKKKELLSVYENVTSKLYYTNHRSYAEQEQKDICQKTIYNLFNDIFNENGDINKEKAHAFLTSKVKVGLGFLTKSEFEAEGVKQPNEVNYKLYSNFNKKYHNSGKENVVNIPKDAMIVEVSIILEMENLSKPKNLAKLNLYVYDNAQFTRAQSLNKFAEAYPKRFKNLINSYFCSEVYFFSEARYKIIKDECLDGNIVNMALYQSAFNGKTVNFVDLNKEV